MAGLSRALTRKRNLPKVRHEPHLKLLPDGSDANDPPLALDALERVANEGRQYGLSLGGVDEDGVLRVPPGASREGAQRFLENGGWRKALAHAPPGSIGQAPTIGDVLRSRHYGDDYDRVVAAADAAALEDRPSYISSRSVLPSEALKDRALMVRSHEGDSQVVPNGGVMSTVDDIEQMTTSPGSYEDAHRAIEGHELTHYLDLSSGFPTKPVFTKEEWARIEPSLKRRLNDEPFAVDRVRYTAMGESTRPPTAAELVANMGTHKRNYFAQNGEVPTTREDARAMFEAMAEKAKRFDYSDPDFDPWEEFGIDPDSAEVIGPWDTYGPDPEAAFGPAKGRALRGAAETEMNLGNIFLEANPEQQSKMIETFLRSVDNKDLRKSLLARTA